jgi:hypothetical protein
MGEADNSPLYFFYECDESEFEKEFNVTVIDMQNREKYTSELKMKESVMQPTQTPIFDNIFND